MIERLRVRVFCYSVKYLESGKVQAEMGNGSLQMLVPLTMDQAKQMLPGCLYEMQLNLFPAEQEKTAARAMLLRVEAKAHEPAAD